MSAKFNGTSSRALLPFRAKPAGNKPASIKVAFRTGETIPNTQQRIISYGKSGGWPGGLRLFINSSGMLCMGTDQGAAKLIVTDLEVKPLSIYNVLMVYDGGAINLYVDSSAPFSYLNAVLTAGTDAALAIGAIYTQSIPGWAEFFSGEMQDVYYWDSVLTDGDIERVFTTGVGSTLVPYTDGWTLLDSGVSANGGTALSTANAITYNPGQLVSVNNGDPVYPGASFPFVVSNITPSSASVDGVTVAISGSNIVIPPYADGTVSPRPGKRTMTMSDGTNTVMYTISVTASPGYKFVQLDYGHNSGEYNSIVYQFNPPAAPKDYIIAPLSLSVDEYANARTSVDGETEFYFQKDTDSVIRTVTLITGTSGNANVRNIDLTDWVKQASSPSYDGNFPKTIRV